MQSKLLQGKALPGSATHPVCPQSVLLTEGLVTHPEEGCSISAGETPL